jgi:hypothetical protein
MPLTKPQSGILGADTLSTTPVSLNIGVPIVENSQIIGASYSITTGSNAMTAGPITLPVGVIVTVPVGSTWSIV